MKTFRKFDFVFAWMCVSLGQIAVAAYHQNELYWRDAFMVVWGTGCAFLILWGLFGLERK